MWCVVEATFYWFDILDTGDIAPKSAAVEGSELVNCNNKKKKIGGKLLVNFGNQCQYKQVLTY